MILLAKSFYGFTRNPFDKNSISERDAFSSCDHRDALNRLTYLKNTRGIGVFTSAPGFGKTYAIRCFVKSLDSNLHDVAYLCLSTVSIFEFYRQLCYALGIDPPHGKPAMFKAIQDRLYHLLKEKKKPFVLILDEAHELSTAVLKDFKMLLNFDFDALNCFTLVLAGEPYLNHTLEKPVHEALRQRIVVHYQFVGLSASETEEYLIHKLRLGGAAASILDPGVISAIAGYARGCPRLIDNLMNKALMLGAQLERPSLDTEIILAAVNDLALT